MQRWFQLRVFGINADADTLQTNSNLGLSTRSENGNEARDITTRFASVESPSWRTAVLRGSWPDKGMEQLFRKGLSRITRYEEKWYGVPPSVSLALLPCLQ